MKLRKAILCVSLIMCTVLFSSATISPLSIAAQASTNSTERTLSDREINDNLSSLANYQDTTQQQISKEVAEKATVTSEGNNTVVSISDYELNEILNKIYGEPDGSDNEIQYVKAGTSKLVFHGKKKSGNVDVYLSKDMLNRIKKAGINAGVSIVAGLFAVVGGVTGLGIAWGVFTYALKKLVTAMIYDNAKNFKAGRIYRLRSWKYAGWRYQ